MENKKTIIALGMILFSISFALCIYGGESYYYDLSNKVEILENFTCNVNSESYDLEGLNFSVNDTGFIITPELNFKPDNLTISCLLNGFYSVQESTGSSNSISISKEKLDLGYEDNLREGKRISFRLGIHKHTFTLTKIYGDYAIFTMRSEPQDINLSIGKCEIVELEEPIEVCLLSLDKRDVDISIKSIDVIEKIINDTEDTKSTSSGSISVVIENNDLQIKESKSFWSYLPLIIGGLFVIIYLIMVIRNIIIKKRLLKPNE